MWPSSSILLIPAIFMAVVMVVTLLRLVSSRFSTEYSPER